MQQVKSNILSSFRSTETASVSKPPAAVPSDEDDEMLQPTPNSDCREMIDESSGRTCYYHIITKEVTLDKPACLAALDDHPPSTESTKPAEGITKVGRWWKAQISVAGICKCIGHFKTPEQAAVAYHVVDDERQNMSAFNDDDAFEVWFKAAKARACMTATKIPLSMPVNQSRPEAKKPLRNESLERGPAGLTDTPGARKVRAREAAGADTKAIISSRNTKGYYQRRDTGKWDAQIKLKEKSKGIGSFATPEGAFAAYQIVRDELRDVNSSIDDDELETLFQAAKKKAREKVMHSGVDIIPSDWRETIDERSGDPYFYHICTNEVTWDKPACLAALDDLILLRRRYLRQRPQFQRSS